MIFITSNSMTVAVKQIKAVAIIYNRSWVNPVKKVNQVNQVWNIATTHSEIINLVSFKLIKW